MEQIAESQLNVFKSTHHLVPPGNVLAITLNLLLRGLYLQPFFLYEVAYHPDSFDVTRCVKTYSLAVATRIDYSELRLPKT